MTDSKGKKIALRASTVPLNVNEYRRLLIGTLPVVGISIYIKPTDSEASLKSLIRGMKLIMFRLIETLNEDETLPPITQEGNVALTDECTLCGACLEAWNGEDNDSEPIDVCPVEALKVSQ